MFFTYFNLPSNRPKQTLISYSSTKGPSHRSIHLSTDCNTTKQAALLGGIIGAGAYLLDAIMSGKGSVSGFIKATIEMGLVFGVITFLATSVLNINVEHTGKTCT